MAVKYIRRNGVMVRADKAQKASELFGEGYSIAKIAEILDLTEHEVVCVLNIYGD